MRNLLIRFILNPATFFHIENGATTVNNRRVRLTDFEVASRLAFRLTSAPPDSVLLNAAQNGQLKSVDSLRMHAKRLLQLRQAEAQLKSEEMISYYGALEKIEPPNEFVLQDAKISDVDLVSEMKREALDFSNHVIWTKKGNFKDLILSVEAFPRSERMSKIFESSITYSSQPVVVKSEFAGFFHRPAYLSSREARTNIIRRGIKLTKNITCQTAPGNPASPDDIKDAFDAISKNITSMTNREIASAITASNTCMQCHSSFNPRGFALESYDQLGRYRFQEKVYSLTGTIDKMFPIDTKVLDTKLIPNSKAPAQNSHEMMLQISQSSNAQACFAKNIYESYYMQMANLSSDSCLLDDIYKSLKTGS